MDSFDLHLALWFNGLARFHILESLVVIVQNNDLIKDAPIVAALWWAFFQAGADRSSRRQRLLSVIVFSLVAVLVARGLAIALPFRVRPLNAGLNDFYAIRELGEGAFVRWSAFPSDNAVLFSCLVTGVWTVSRKLGAFGAAYFLVFVCFPRLVAGIHWPLDIIAGCVIGVGIAAFALTPRVRSAVGGTLEGLLERAPGPMYAALFLLSFQIARLFDETINLGMVVVHGLKHFL